MYWYDEFAYGVPDEFDEGYYNQLRQYAESVEVDDNPPSAPQYAMETRTVQTNDGPKNCTVIKAKVIRVTKGGEAQIVTVAGQTVNFDGVKPDQIKALIKQVVSSGGMATVENSPVNVKHGYVVLVQQLNQLLQQQKQPQKGGGQAAKVKSPKKSDASEKKQARDDDEKKPAALDISIEEYKAGTCTEADRQSFMNELAQIIRKFMKNHNDEEGVAEKAEHSDSLDSHGKKSFASVLSQEVSARILELELDGVSLGRIHRAFSALGPNEFDIDEDDSEDDDSDDEHSEELSPDELEFVLECIKHHEDSAKLASLISAGNWKAVEDMVRDRVLEQEEKERKAAKKREKKQRKKAKLKEEAAQKAADAAQKKREKAIISWRSRVISAMQSNDVSRLRALLHESPLRNERENAESSSQSTIGAHLDFLLPNTVAKSRADAKVGSEARLRLSDFVFSLDPSMAFKPLRSGLTAFHTACFYGDLQVARLVFDKTNASTTDAPFPDNFLDMTCQESGLSPLHYASIACSDDVMEFLLEKGCGVCTPSIASLTWTSKDGKGVTCLELIQYLLSGDIEENVQTKGVALQEIVKTFMSNHGDRKHFLESLERVRARLADVEENGYTTPSSNTTDTISNAAPASVPDADSKPSEGSPSKNKKKKRKKKNKGGKNSDVADPSIEVVDLVEPDASAAEETKDDPVVQALLMMGFERAQIDEAVVACGGTDRATADDVVTWILGQGNDESSPVEEEKKDEDSDMQQEHVEEDSSSGSEKDVVSDEDSSDQADELASKKSIAKREETRRRNREWNNREQARHEHHKKVLIAQKALQHKYAMRKTPSPGTSPQLLASSARPFELGSRPVATSHTDDDGTVSSFGSNRGLSVSSQEFIPTNFTAAPPRLSLPNKAQRQQVNLPPGLSTNMPPPGLAAPTTQPLPVRHQVSVPPGLLSQIPQGAAPDTVQPMVAPVKPPANAVFHSAAAVPSFQDILDVEIRASASKSALLPNEYGSPDIFGSLGTSSGLVPDFPPSNNRLGSHRSVFPRRRHSSFDPAPSVTSVSDESTVSLSSLFGGHVSDELSSAPPMSFVGGETKAASRLRNPIASAGMVSTSSLWENAGDHEIPSLASKLPIFLVSEEGDSEDNQLLWNNNDDDGKLNISSGGGQSSIW